MGLAVVTMLLIAASLVNSSKVEDEPNPPVWPKSVVIFGPNDPPGVISSAVLVAFGINGGHSPPNNGQFSSARFAFLFRPGTYTVDVPVGFYTHVLGLGSSPDDVVFAGDKGVFSEEGDYSVSGGALDSFWRAAENFKTTSAHPWSTGTGMMWAVSQAAPLRRVHITQGLNLYEYVPPAQAAGFASGGYLGNSRVDGAVFPGSQQQWFTRNSHVGSWEGGVWNHVFLGTDGAPPSHCSNVKSSPITTVDSTPSIAEKPFLSIDSNGKFSLNIPGLRTQAEGTDWSTGTVVPFEKVYVASNETDNATSINSKLALGLHVVLTPGFYFLDAPLMINTAGQVLLGVGFPTLVPLGSHAVIEVGNVDGVRLAGPFLLQAGTQPTKSLLQWGDGSHGGDPTNPGIMYDIFARVGGPDWVAVQAESMVRIDSGHTILDNAWLWRADHTVAGLVRESANPCSHGLVVTGSDVLAYGLAVEHTLQDLTLWLGERGATYFYQSELPYDVTQANFGDLGYVGYRVNATVTQHEAYAVGVYHYFRDYPVTVKSGISAAPGVLSHGFTAPLVVYLNGLGTVQSVLSDGRGSATGPGIAGVSYVCGNSSNDHDEVNWDLVLQ